MARLAEIYAEMADDPEAVEPPAIYIELS